MTNFKPFQISAVNALSLILFGAYGYLQSLTPSITALIPVIFGLMLLAFNRGIKKENKVIAHLAVFLTLIAFLGLVMALVGALKRSNVAAVARVGFMMLTTLTSLAYFIKSFISARKLKA
tara:strand:- start:240 stop:599 length:360 start_codon:yes stop_codon:yes gene_type:complete